MKDIIILGSQIKSNSFIMLQNFAIYKTASYMIDPITTEQHIPRRYYNIKKENILSIANVTTQSKNEGP